MTWSTANAWREIMERVFEGFERRDDFAPSWMTNPRTGRRLKLDRYYPELGIAFRFAGLQGRQNYRVSDEEVQQEEDRKQIRDYLCQQQGVTLIHLDVDEAEPWRLVQRIRAALSRTSRLLAQSDVEVQVKRNLAPRIAAARSRCDQIISQVKKADGLKLYADLWQDRQYTESMLLDAPSEARPAPSRSYRQGMEVRHPTFGRGTVVGLRPEAEGDTLVIVQFDNGTERKFLSSLVSDKLLPAK